MARKHLRVYYDMMPAIEALSDAEAGRLLKGVLKYGLSSELPTFSGNERFTWPLFMAQIDQENADYAKRCEINKTNRHKSSRIVTSRDESSQIVNERKERTKEKKYINNTRFIPPTLEDVKEYCMERMNSVDAERFFSYYESNGWRVGKNPMKDWKAAVRTWERSDSPAPKQSSGNIFLQMLKEEGGSLDD